MRVLSLSLFPRLPMLLGTTYLPPMMDAPALLSGMCEPESGPLALVLNAFLK